MTQSNCIRKPNKQQVTAPVARRAKYIHKNCVLWDICARVPFGLYLRSEHNRGTHSVSMASHVHISQNVMNKFWKQSRTKTEMVDFSGKRNESNGRNANNPFVDEKKIAQNKMTHFPLSWRWLMLRYRINPFRLAIPSVSQWTHKQFVFCLNFRLVFFFFWLRFGFSLGFAQDFTSFILSGSLFCRSLSSSSTTSTSSFGTVDVTFPTKWKKRE